jgi:exopolysaccharide production protein ExoZ
MSSGRTVDGIQYLRGIAALLVVISHSNGLMRFPEYFGTSPFALENLGGFGVSIFFVISGFIIAIVSLGPTGEAVVTPGQFAARRFRRIVPFMWLCIVGYNIFTFAGTHQVEWGPAIRALFLWPVGDLKPNVIWTLRHEALFYALFAVTLLTARRRPVLLALWCLAPIPVTAAASTFPETFAALHPWLQDLVNVLLCGRGANLQFGIGLIAGLLWLRRHPAMSPMLPGGPLVPVGIAVACALLYQAVTPMLQFNPVQTVPVSIIGPTELFFITVLAALIVWTGVILKPSSGWIERLAHVLGDASFSIYLVHNAAILALLEISRRVEVELPLPLVLIAIAVVATASGVAVHYLIEKPLLQRLTARRRQPASETAA